MERIITLNIGSSSCRFQIFNRDLSLKGKGIIEKIGLPGSNIIYTEDGREDIREYKDITFEDLDKFLVDFINNNEVIVWENVILMVHRFVNGADVFTSDTIIDSEEKFEKLKSLVYLAPLHHPRTISAIEIMREKFPHIKQAVSFDTSFHSTIPKINYTYALPTELCEEHKIRKYGAHGQSHGFVTEEMVEHFGRPVNIINAHLGNGQSICVTKQSKSKNTSMGFTPMSGIPMGTRTGDIDPSIPLFLINEIKMDPKEVTEMLNGQSGYVGMSGVSSDMRVVTEAAKNGNERAQFTLDLSAKRIAETITMYLSEVPVVDAITFTGGIGENNPDFIRNIFKYLKAKEIEIKENINTDYNVNLISKVGSQIPVFIVPTNEELYMAKVGLRLLNK